MLIFSFVAGRTQSQYARQTRERGAIEACLAASSTRRHRWHSRWSRYSLPIWKMAGALRS